MSLLGGSKTLVVVGSGLDAASYIALNILLEVLKSREIEVGLLVDAASIAQYQQVIPLTPIEVLTKVPPRKVVLTFNKGDEEVKSVQWMQEDSKLTLHILMQQGSFQPKDMQATPSGGNYDTVVFWQVPNFEDVSKYFSDNPALLGETVNLALGGTPTVQDVKVESLDIEALTLPAALYQHLKGQGATARHYSELLAGILLSTTRFSQAVTAQIFTICAELVANGADATLANQLYTQLSNLDLEVQPILSTGDAQEPEAAAAPPQPPEDVEYMEPEIEQESEPAELEPAVEQTA